MTSNHLRQEWLHSYIRGGFLLSPFSSSATRVRTGARYIRNSFRCDCHHNWRTWCVNSIAEFDDRGSLSRQQKYFFRASKSPVFPDFRLFGLKHWNTKCLFSPTGFIEMMSAYFDDFANIEPATVCSWIFQLESQLSAKHKETGGGGSGDGPNLSLK